MSDRVSCGESGLGGGCPDTGQADVSTPGAKTVSTPPLSQSEGGNTLPHAGGSEGTNTLPRASLRARWLIWRGQKLIALGLLIPVHVRRGGWRQRLADGLLHRGADCLVRAFRMGARS